MTRERKEQIEVFVMVCGEKRVLCKTSHSPATYEKEKESLRKIAENMIEKRFGISNPKEIFAEITLNGRVVSKELL